MDKLKSIYSSSYSAVISIILTVILTIGMEFSFPTKAWLAGFTGHHWITKSWISIIVFVIFFVVLKYTKKSVNEAQVRTALFSLQLVTVIGFISILSFYIYEFLI